MNYQVQHRGLGQALPPGVPTPAQVNAASQAIAAFQQAQLADQQAGLTAPSTQTQAAGQRVGQLIQGGMIVGSGAPTGTAAASTASSSTPYIIAGIVGVVVLGGLIYAATK